MLRLPHSWVQRLSRPNSFWLFLSLGIALRLVWVIWQAGQPLLGDAFEYATVAKQIGNGQLTTGYWPPFLPHYLAPWTWLPGDSDAWLRLAMLPWFIALAFQLKRTIGPWLSGAAAHAALGLIAVYPAFLLHGAEPLSQLPAAVLLLGAARHLFLNSEPPNWKNGVKGGSLLAALVLLRPSALLLTLVIPIYLAWRHKRVVVLTAAVIPLIVAGLWSTAISRQEGFPIWVNRANSLNLYLGNNAWTPMYKTWYYGSHWVLSPENPKGFTEEISELRQLPPSKQAPAYLSKAFAEWRSAPGRSLVRTGSRMRTFWAFDTLAGARFAGPHDPHPAFGYFLLIGDAFCYAILLLGALLAFLHFPTYRPFLWLGLLYAFPYFLSFSHPTFHMPVAVIWLIPAFSWWTRPESQPWTSRQKTIGILLATAFILIQTEWVWHMLRPGI